MDGPASRSGQRLCAHINYPLPLIDCQTLCVWKPPTGPDVNNCSNSGCVVRQEGRVTQTYIMWTKYISQAVSCKKGIFIFYYNLSFVVFQCLIMRSRCIPLKQEMRTSWARVRTTVVWVMASLSSLSHKVEFRGEINWIWFQGSPSQAGRFVLKQPDSSRQTFDPALTDSAQSVLQRQCFKWWLWCEFRGQCAYILQRAFLCMKSMCMCVWTHTCKYSFSHSVQSRKLCCQDIWMSY